MEPHLYLIMACSVPLEVSMPLEKNPCIVPHFKALTGGQKYWVMEICGIYGLLLVFTVLYFLALSEVLGHEKNTLELWHYKR